MARKTEDPRTARREAAGDGAARRDHRHPGAEPSPVATPTARVGRGELRDPLGDFSEQTGAFFG